MEDTKQQVPTSTADLSVGMEITDEFAFSEDEMTRFGELVRDEAPVHFDSEFAERHGFEAKIVFGFLVASRFSGMLGMRLPGPHTVIHSAQFQMPNPVFVGDTIRYTVTVKQLSASTGAVVLDLLAQRTDGTCVLRGRSQCGFSR